MWDKLYAVLVIIVLFLALTGAGLYVMLLIYERRRKKEREAFLKQMYNSRPPRIPRIRPGTGIHRPAPPPPPPARVIREGVRIENVSDDGGISASDLAALAMIGSMSYSGSSVAKESETVERVYESETAGGSGGAGASSSWDDGSSSGSSSGGGE